MGANKNRFRIDIIGLPALLATKVSGLNVIKHTPNKTAVGNQPMPILGRGVSECGEVTVSHAEGLEGAKTVGSAVHAWVRSYTKGIDTTKRGGRVIEFDEDGVSPLAEYELRNCVPTGFKSDDKDAGSGDASYFEFTFIPEDTQRY